MLQGAQLIVFDAAVIVHFVHLELAQAQDKIGGATVAGTAFGAARITPGLPPQPARRARVLDGKFFFIAFGRDQGCVRLRLVPTIGIAGPLPGLSQQQPGFDPPAGAGIARFAFK